MITDFLKTIVIASAAAGTLFVGTTTPDQAGLYTTAISFVERLGSFALVVIAIVGTIWVIVPRVIQWVENREAKFLEDIKAEREIRSQNHKEILAALKEGNEINRNLVNEMRARPCQK